MDTSKLSRSDLIGALASAALVLSLFFLDWYDLSRTDPRANGEDFICGVDQFSCTGFDTFPILRWLLLAAAIAPPVLAWIIARGHTLSWAPGEMTMVVGFTAFILVAYNGIIDRPGSGGEEIGVSLQLGYWVALLACVGIAAAGIARVLDAQRGQRKTPGMV